MTMTVLLEMTLNTDVASATEVIREVLTQTRDREGNTGIDILIDDDDPSKIVIVESWATVEARTAYAEWRQTPEGANRLGSIMAAPPVFRTFTEGIEL